MAFRLTVYLLASLLLVAPRVSSDDQSFWEAFYVKPPVKTPTLPVPAPTKAPAPAPVTVLPPVNVKECPRLCAGRCKLHSRINQCSRVCITCCQRCKCVPPGTYGNRLMCGKCYSEMRTHSNKFKCP